MHEIRATLDNDTAGELGALAAAHGFTPDALAAAFIVEGIGRHTGTHSALEGLRACDDMADDDGAIWGQE